MVFGGYPGCAEHTAKSWPAWNLRHGDLVSARTYLPRARAIRRRVRRGRPHANIGCPSSTMVPVRGACSYMRRRDIAPAKRNRRRGNRNKEVILDFPTEERPGRIARDRDRCLGRPKAGDDRSPSPSMDVRRTDLPSSSAPLPYPAAAISSCPPCGSEGSRRWRRSWSSGGTDAHNHGPMGRAPSSTTNHPTSPGEQRGRGFHFSLPVSQRGCGGTLAR